MALEPGVRLGPYEIVSLLGKGGMGEVYRARDTKYGRHVAIKLLLALSRPCFKTELTSGALPAWAKLAL